MDKHTTCPIIIGISGLSGSGKTTIATKMQRAFQEKGLAVASMSQDYYYRDQKDIPLAQRSETNYDVPEAFEHDLLVKHLQTLKTGKAIQAPVYEFDQHTRNPSKTQLIKPADIIIIEGILLFHDNEVFNQFNHSIFIEAQDEICFARRLERDIKERGRTEASVREAWTNKVQPSIDQYIRPSAWKAQLSIDNSHANYRQAHKLINQFVSEVCRKRINDAKAASRLAKKKRKIEVISSAELMPIAKLPRKFTPTTYTDLHHESPHKIRCK